MARVDAETGKVAVRFETDSDRHAWRDYAVAALRAPGIMPPVGGLHTAQGGRATATDAYADEGQYRADQAARVADAMLLHEQARRSEKTRRRR